MGWGRVARRHTAGLCGVKSLNNVSDSVFSCLYHYIIYTLMISSIDVQEDRPWLQVKLKPSL